jgi:cysteate synthase
MSQQPAANSAAVASRPAATTGHAQVVCCQCGRAYDDCRLRCDTCPDALLRTVYRARTLETGDAKGVFRFTCWLPSSDVLPTSVGTAIVHAERYGRRLGLKRLVVAYNGYWPERGAGNPTGTFKDLEAAPTLAWLRAHGRGAIVLASAGNTARAFAHACSAFDHPACIVVPETAAARLWITRPPSSSIRVIACRGSSYADAIRLAERMADRFGMTSEGGARNVARRDGLGTTLLHYATTLGRMPDHYVQAVGSGAGAIAAYEACLRLRADGRFGSRLPRQHLVQNLPVIALHRAWAADRAASAAMGEIENESESQPAFAPVLQHARPPYGLTGGVRTVLEQTDGVTYAVGAGAAARARQLFEREEGIDIDEASACACAGLEIAIHTKRIGLDDDVLLHITGGGGERLRRDFGSYPLPLFRDVVSCDRELTDDLIGP